MKLETFFEKFELFADSPNAVAKMRELVLELAFSGGLSGKRATANAVPDGWESRTIESISASISSGFACSRSHQVENGHIHLRTHNISTLGTLNFDLLVRIDPKMVDPKKSSIRAGDILFNNTNSQELVGKTSLVDRDYDYGYSNHINRIRLKDGIFPGFVVFYLTLLRNSGYFARLCTRWINQAAVNTDMLKEQTIPLPPLAEQKRIVAKVDELMALCDRLEAQQQEREEKHKALSRASLARFADAPTPANLQFIFHPSYTIAPADLRKSILTLAVQGKLVPQDPNDEPAEPAVAQIEKERERLIAAKQFRRSQLSGPLDEGPFDIPKTWIWTHLGNAMLNVTDGFHSTPKTVESGVRYVTAKHVKPGLIDFDSCLFVSEDDFKEIASKTRPRKGDVLVVNIGAGSGLASIIEADFEFAFKNVAILNRPEEVDSKFLFNYLVFKRDDIFEEQTKGGAQPFLSLGLIRQIPFPLPPHAEQRRIVAKVEELMKLVDALETQLATSRTTAANLLAAIVAELTGTPNTAKASVPASTGTGTGRRGRPPKS